MTKVMRMGGTRKLEVELDGQELEQMKKLVYLVLTVTEAAKSERELKFGQRKQHNLCYEFYNGKCILLNLLIKKIVLFSFYHSIHGNVQYSLMPFNIKNRRRGRVVSA